MVSASLGEFRLVCETYTKTGRMMPEDGLAQMAAIDAIFLGAVGYPGCPITFRSGLLIPIRREFHHMSIFVRCDCCRVAAPLGS